MDGTIWTMATTAKSIQRRRRFRPRFVIEPGASFERIKEQQRLEDLVQAIERENLDKRQREDTRSIEFLKDTNQKMKQAEQMMPHHHDKRKNIRRNIINNNDRVWGDGQPFAVDYCHVYQSKQRQSVSSRLTQRAYEVGLQAIQRAEQANNSQQQEQGLGRPCS